MRFRVSRMLCWLRPRYTCDHDGPRDEKENHHAKLIAQQWVSVDNIAAEEDGGLRFVSGEPFSETTNPAFKATVMGFIDSVDTMILGSNADA
jgi:hypothetical protein